ESDAPRVPQRHPSANGYASADSAKQPRIQRRAERQAERSRQTPTKKRHDLEVGEPSPGLLGSDDELPVLPRARYTIPPQALLELRAAAHPTLNLSTGVSELRSANTTAPKSA